MKLTGLKATELRSVREAQGVSPDDLAMTSGLATSTIRSLERGRMTTLSTVKSLAEALGVPVEDILANEDKDSGTTEELWKQSVREHQEKQSSSIGYRWLRWHQHLSELYLQKHDHHRQQAQKYQSYETDET